MALGAELKTIHIVIPSIDGKLTCDTFSSLWKFARATSFELDFRVSSWNQDVVRVRNRAAYEFLRGKCDALWFVDADVGFDTDVPVRLINSGFDVVAAAYPKKRITWGVPRSQMVEWTYRPMPGTEMEVVDGVPYQECEVLPMGCTLIQRHVIETIAAKCERYGDQYQSELHEVPNMFGLMMAKSATGGPDSLLPEDYSFSVRARACGFQLWTLGDPICTHTGSYKFDAREIGR
jgi:hypothetical protein